MMQLFENDAPLRRSLYALFVVAAVGGMIGRILAVNSVDRVQLDKYLRDHGRVGSQQRPFLSANDRSRWCTVRALVERGTYQIDEIVLEPNWDTIDMVKHDEHLYSSKPPLLSTLVAGEYWLVYRLTGCSLGTHPYEIGRLLLITTNVVPMLVYFLILVRLVERYGATDWGRFFVIASATFGTFLTTFAIALNNHLVAAVSALVAVDAVIRIWFEEERRLRWFLIAGLFSAFTAACELPALALTAIVLAALAWRFLRPAMIALVPAMALVAAASLGTNYLAHGTIQLAYERKDWYDYTYLRNGQERESYWRHREGIDKGEPCRAAYAVHALVGHHGIFSLTPIWLLSVAGIVIHAARRKFPLRSVALLTAMLSVVCFAFYLSRPQVDRNYGGMTSGLRWMFWFTPLWLLAMLPAVDTLAPRRWGRGLALLLLGFSVLAASYPTWNPWTHPWLTNLFLYVKWIQF